MAAASKSGERKRRRPSGATEAAAADPEQPSAVAVRSASRAAESTPQSSERTQDANRASDATTGDDADDTARAPASTVEAQEAQEDLSSDVATRNSTAAAARNIDIPATLDDDSDDGDEEDDDVLVVLELADFKNHPIFDDYASVRIEGIDTASPTLQIGEYTLYGQLEETVGTNFFYDTTKLRAHGDVYQYVGQTTKKIRFTIAPPPEQ